VKKITHVKRGSEEKSGEIFSYSLSAEKEEGGGGEFPSKTKEKIKKEVIWLRKRGGITRKFPVRMRTANLLKGKGDYLFLPFTKRKIGKP